ncbi:hypothetical protein [Nostoc sp. WHI]|uniref:hypothetical protein n=1 Tax=Nostoc sp. WHI TaxID=2650611 RepID=UPI0018C5935C|nr:hypothetical protein [Nostoc sp. WHI]MBG1266924.1 hypothetical protein [Nostoc sp. WHI]
MHTHKFNHHRIYYETSSLTYKLFLLSNWAWIAAIASARPNPQAFLLSFAKTRLLAAAPVTKPIGVTTIHTKILSARGDGKSL